MSERSDGVARESYRETVARLASRQKRAAPGAPAYSVFVNRRVGRYIAAAAYRAGLTPDAVTGISAALTFVGIGMIALVPPQWWLGPVVWLLLAVGYAFDSADGQVARLRGGGSLAGEWLDHVVDCVKLATLHLAVLITAFRHFAVSDGWLLVPMAFGAVGSVTFFAMILNDQLRRHDASAAVAAGTPMEGSALRSLLLLPTDYGIQCLMFVLLGFPALFVPVYTLAFAASAGFAVLALPKWLRAMRRHDARQRGEADPAPDDGRILDAPVAPQERTVQP
ncbi:CDP-alcohol phosphatidyltransferase family protein [Tersicoccus sp. Bi-70]|uniref:CDP-alcohol phosphatidyltransferase family protein n=1 Tax=Tersicoccus sp. Bi-70 TaxID=1897634 RepID=UPI00097862B8|nr:CDP-alcohol phosphatidyltransferase family protein [Tersicoccus sp. Bi-70]OMH31376.1 CDP-alcohol phosphatidyltransferase [Tersicoccus sp. Bi-70]